MFLLLATTVFLLVGIGVRWLGGARIWRAVRRNAAPDAAAWRLLGWGVVAGIAIPFVLDDRPLRRHAAVLPDGPLPDVDLRGRRAGGVCPDAAEAAALAIAAAIALAFPSSGHYLARKWTDQERAAARRPQPRRGGGRRASARDDPETTVVLHDRPLSPSLTTIVAARRIVLGWDVRYSAVGGEGRLRDVNRFYSSADGNADAALDTLRRYQVTHVIVRPQDDHVHPAVLEKLKLILQFPDVVLYEVPPL